MHAWFYHQHTIPEVYARWITKMAKFIFIFIYLFIIFYLFVCFVLLLSLLLLFFFMLGFTTNTLSLRCARYSKNAEIFVLFYFILCSSYYSYNDKDNNVITSFSPLFSFTPIITNLFHFPSVFPSLFRMDPTMLYLLKDMKEEKLEFAFFFLFFFQSILFYMNINFLSLSQKKKKKKKK